MLCGIFPPTSGKAYMMGFNLKNQLDQIRSIVGFCPQVDILFDDLSVKEHLKLIAMVNKSVSFLFFNLLANFLFFV